MKINWVSHWIEIYTEDSSVNPLNDWRQESNPINLWVNAIKLSTNNYHQLSATCLYWDGSWTKGNNLQIAWFPWSSIKYLGNYKLCHLRKTISGANFCLHNHLFFRLHSAVRIKKSINYLKSLWLHFILLFSLLWRRKPLTWATFLFLFLKIYLIFLMAIKAI